MTIDEQLRKAANTAIQEGRHTRYAIAKGAGVDHSAFASWLDEHSDIRVSTVNKLAAFLGLELRPIEQKPARKRRK